MSEDAVVRSISTQRIAAISVAACGAIWGGFWYPLRWLDAMGVGSAWVSLIFFAVATLGPLPWLASRPQQRGAVAGQVLTGLLLGTAFSLYTVSLVMTDVIHAILLFYLTPVWSTIGGVLLFGERLTMARAAVMLLGLGGMISIFGIADGLPVPRNAGDWIALVSGISWSIGSLRSYNRPSSSVALPALTFALGGLLSSGIILAAAAAMVSPLAATTNLAPALPWIAGLALLIFVPPNFLVLWAAQRIDPGRIGILLMTEVLAGSLSAALFSGDAFGAGEAAGTVMILCAGLIEVLGRR